jgi:hypothetical protein
LRDADESTLMHDCPPGDQRSSVRVAAPAKGGGVHHPRDQAADDQPVAVTHSHGGLEAPARQPTPAPSDRQLGPKRAGGQMALDRLWAPTWSPPARPRPTTAAAIACSARASTRGLASAGTSPLPTPAAVSLSVTV